MTRTIFAVIAGFFTMSVLVTAGTVALVAGLVPGGLARMKSMRGDPEAMPVPTPRYLAANILLSFLAAIAGGYVTARITGPESRTALIALGVLVLAMGTITALSRSGARQPVWYRYLIPALGAAGVALSRVLLPS